MRKSPSALNIHGRRDLFSNIYLRIYKEQGALQIQLFENRFSGVV